MRQSLEDWQKNHTAISHAVVQHWYISVLFFQILLYTNDLFMHGFDWVLLYTGDSSRVGKEKGRGAATIASTSSSCQVA
jgi:hypothetical protein